MQINCVYIIPKPRSKIKCHFLLGDEKLCELLISYHMIKIWSNKFMSVDLKPKCKKKGELVYFLREWLDDNLTDERWQMMNLWTRGASGTACRISNISFSLEFINSQWQTTKQNSSLCFLGPINSLSFLVTPFQSNPIQATNE